MKKSRIRSKVRRIKWKKVLFALGNRKALDDFNRRVQLSDMSTNRCAYYSLIKNYSTTYTRLWRDLYEDYGCEYEELWDASHNIPKVKWL